MVFARSPFWSEGKAAVVGFLGVPDPLLHLVLGLAGFLALARILRGRRHALVIAWGAVALAQLVNEFLDARDWIHWTGTVNWSEAAWDTGLTLALPSAILLGCLVSRRLREKSLAPWRPGDEQ